MIRGPHGLAHLSEIKSGNKVDLINSKKKKMCVPGTFL